MSNDFKRIIRDSLPRYYDDLVEAQEIIGAQVRMNENVYTATQDLLAQFFVQTATWGIERWAKIVDTGSTEWPAVLWSSNDMRILDDLEGQTWDSLEFEYAEARSSILAKLRGAGTITKQRIIEIAASYTGGTVTVTEVPADYKVIIEFIDVQGVPTGLARLQTILREVMPAHLQIEFKLKYQTWNQFDALAWTFDDLDTAALTFDDFDSL